MPAFEKAPEVDEDLQEIVVYTAERWGVAQVRKYMAGLERKMNDLAAGQAHSNALDHVLAGLKVARYEHHYIFGVARLDAPMLILAVFHEKMNVISRLKSRLSP